MRNPGASCRVNKRKAKKKKLLSGKEGRGSGRECSEAIGILMISFGNKGGHPIEELWSLLKGG